MSAFARVTRGPGELQFRCGCHGTETLARVVDGALVVNDRRHGELHSVRIPLADVARLLDTSPVVPVTPKP